MDDILDGLAGRAWKKITFVRRSPSLGKGNHASWRSDEPTEEQTDVEHMLKCCGIKWCGPNRLPVSRAVKSLQECSYICSELTIIGLKVTWTDETVEYIDLERPNR